MDNIGKRVSVNKRIATIKFHGTINNKEYYGIDYDDLNGKHDGSINGISYFKSTTCSSSSFIKPHLISFGSDFASNLLNKYSTHDTDTLIPFSRKLNVEAVGWNKMHVKLLNYELINCVGLSMLDISSVGDLRLVEDFKFITDLDLSRNLIDEWNLVHEICSFFATIESLRLNYNRLKVFDVGMFTSVKVLSLNYTLISWNDVEQIDDRFPNLTELFIGFNNLKISSSKTNGFEKLKTLSVESNQITWTDFSNRFKSSNLENVNLSNNEISSLDISTRDFKSLSFLNISQNKIDSWISIDQINNLTLLSSLRIKQNPIGTMNLIARLGKLKYMDGCFITERDRIDAELYYLSFISKLNLGIDEIVKLHPQYSRLVGIHGEPIFKKEESSKLNSLPEFTFVLNGVSKRKKMPIDIGIRQLKSLVGRIFKVTIDELSVDGVVMDQVKNLDYYCHGGCVVQVSVGRQ